MTLAYRDGSLRHSPVEAPAPVRQTRALLLAAILEPLPLRHDLEGMVDPDAPLEAAHAVDALVDGGLLEVVGRYADRVRLTDAGRRSFASLPGDPRPREFRVTL